jgi:hypothetical protein
MASVGLDAATLGILAGVITAAVELIKSWVPKKYKDENGLIIYRAKGTKHIHIPNQAIWPLLSLIIGVSIFMAIKYNVFGPDVPEAGGSALSGAASSFASNGVFRAKNALGKLTGGTDETSAQNTGPALASATPDSVLATMTTIDPAIAPVVEEVVLPTIQQPIVAAVPQPDTAHVF